MTQETISQARKEVALVAFESADFEPFVVEAMDCFVEDEDKLVAIAYLQSADAPFEESISMHFGVHFLPGTADQVGDPEFYLPEMPERDECDPNENTVSCEI